MSNKKKHHVVPATYLAGFVDSSDKLYEYRKDEPDSPRYNVPKEVGHRRYYYSQPMPDGGRDDNSLEDFFDRELESKWPDLRRKVCQGKRLTREDHVLLFKFVGMLRVRVPAARDSVEHILAEMVKKKAERLDRIGALPLKPPHLEDFDLLAGLRVSIDPHQSIHAMLPMLEGFGLVLDSIGFKIFENKTSIPFITSDNPVSYFDHDAPEKKMLPYAVVPNLTRVELIFPLDNKHILHGHSDYRESFVRDGIVYDHFDRVKCARRFNRLICKFGYEKIFACSTEHASLIKKHSSLSPVLNIGKTRAGGRKQKLHTYVFGKRSKLARWTKAS